MSLIEQLGKASMIEILRDPKKMSIMGNLADRVSRNAFESFRQGG